MKKIIAFLILGLLLIHSGMALAADDTKGKINLNSATKEQLVSVGIEESLADAIIELRTENEEFVDMDELLDVDGITPSLLRSLKKKLFIEEIAGCNC